MLPKPLSEILKFKGQTPEVIGSAADDRIKYPSDIDTQMIIKDVSPSEVWEYFRIVIFKLLSHPKILFLEFKAGMYFGQGVKWSPAEIYSGVKTFDFREYFFRDVFGHPSIIKMDLVFIESPTDFKEISVNYYFTLKGTGFNTFIIYTDEEMKTNLLHEAVTLENQGNTFKALKRLFSYYKFIGKDVAPLIKVFNSDLGFFSQQISRLKTVVEILNPRTFGVLSKKIILNYIENVYHLLRMGMPPLAHMSTNDISRTLEKEIESMLLLLNSKTLKAHSSLLIPIF